ncbi:MAG: DUF2177 family protein [Parvibaculum sp.]|nr:DUF2177 family protein [Parvibaculum sp.]|tara:strand:+ start:1770 stop:2180 length:411 start_codon:yes stop_codon:yes gene_type:complete
MLRIITAYISTGLVFVVIDAIWLSNMGGWYRRMMGDLLLPEFRLVPAMVFYFLFMAGLVIFAVAPALNSGKLSTALLYGALFGFFTYVTYDLTNQSTLIHWPVQLAVVDIIWGTVLSAASATLGTLIARSVLERLS